MRLIISSVILLMSLFTACSPQPCGKVLGGKPKYLWFDASANFKRFAQKDSIDYYLDKAVEAGFNHIVVDVRPVEGEALYKSEILTEMKRLGQTTIERDWDYLQYFIDQAHARGLKITAGTTMFPVGSPHHKIGPAYYPEPQFEGRTTLQYTPDGMVDIRTMHSSEVAAFLNPAMPENQEYALSFVKEIVEKYDIDGYSLDYCRYPNMYGDFSDFSRSDFEKYLGEKIENWPQDIFSFNEKREVVPGKYYREWWSYRAKVISDFVDRTTQTIKAIKSDVEVVYWAGGWIYGLYGTGQNWASPRHPIHLDPYNEVWCNRDYMNAGFADKIDAFMLGAYLNDIYGLDNHNSIEYSVCRANNLTKGDCRMYGTIYALNHELNIEDAVYVCLRDSEGLMVFDICQVIQFDLWEDIRRGVERGEPQLKREK